MDRRVGLGHSRLAVIDLSSAAHQPMADRTGGLHVVFNGEIYNYSQLRDDLIAKGQVFRTLSDTEVLLAAYREWGTGCVQHLSGMFAFAIYDSREQFLFMARDRVGEKPLYYSHLNGHVRFASELKALMADPSLSRRIDREALDCYLTMGFVPGERAILQKVNKLPPAHALVFNLQTGQVRTWRYWKLPEPDAALATGLVDETELVDELESLLECAVRQQLVADVPVGILLSGGTDSSLITAMAVRAAPRVKTFTVRFEGHTKHDETEHARLIARHFGTQHVELNAAETGVDLLPHLARQFDEPIVDSSMVPMYLVSQLIRRHCTVALGGDGGDELFGGYSHYRRLLWGLQRLGWIPRNVRLSVAKAATHLLPVGYRGRNWLQGLATDLKMGLPLIASYFDPLTRRALMCRHPGWPLVGEGIREQRIPICSDLLQRATRMDFENYLAEDILVKVDRASMANSLEVRAPMLDSRLIEFAFGKVPAHLKATVSGQKLLLKKLALRVLPAGFDHNRKQGFSIPLESWLRSGPWREFFQDLLLSKDSCLFNPQIVRGLLAGQSRGLANGERLFSLALFELWRREYRVSI